jgi:hypothetical protein
MMLSWRMDLRARYSSTQGWCTMSSTLGRSSGFLRRAAHASSWMAVTGRRQQEGKSDCHPTSTQACGVFTAWYDLKRVCKHSQCQAADCCVPGLSTAAIVCKTTADATHQRR